MRDVASQLIDVGGAALISGLIFALIARYGAAPDRSRKVNFWYVPAWRPRDRAEWDARYGPTIARLGITGGLVLLAIGVALHAA